MVNKGSFFSRLKERWTSGSGVRVERNGGRLRASERAERANVERVDGEAAEDREVSSTFAPVQARSQRKLSEREEALMALSTHFKELTTMLRGSHSRVDDQLTRLVSAANSLSNLPAIGQQQLDVLNKLGAHMEKQNELGEQVAATMTKLPSLLLNVESALARAAATDERTATTVREFQATMDRIHGSMNKMVEHSAQQVDATRQLAERRDESLQDLAAGITESQQRATTELQRATDESMQTLRRAHEDQSNRLQRVVQESAGWNRAVLVGIGLVVLGIGALIALQLLK
jgi:hypothetical protein